MNLGTAQVIRADARNLPLADNTVDLVVTSPPYFALRSYQDGGEHYAGQIGSEPTPAEFVAALLEVTRECVRVLKPSGSLWVNLGDKYASSPPSLTSERVTGLRDRQVRKFPVAQKSLIGIPWRYALACIDDLGLILRAEIIWSKPNGLPESVTDRVRRSHEQWFHFTLEPRYFSAVDEIREEYRQIQHARGQAPNGANPLTGGAPTNHPRNPLGALPGSVWTVPTEPLRVPDHLGIDHFAAFPTEWPKRIIRGWSPAGVCVECGEGRRPVVDLDLTDAPGGAKHDRCHSIDNHGEKNGGRRLARAIAVRSVTGYACACTPHAFQPDPLFTLGCLKCHPDPHSDGLPPTTPAVVLDPFGGTGTVAMVAKALGRHGISVDMSADYCRLAEWRTNDRDQLAKVLGIEKAGPVDDDQLDLFGESA